MQIHARMVAAACFAVVAGNAHAASTATMLTPQKLLNEFNTIAFDDMYSSQHVDGRGYVGGNLHVQNQGTFYQTPGTDPAPSSGFAELYVGGNVYGTAKLLGGSDVQVRGSVAGLQMQNGVAGGQVLIGGQASNLEVGNQADVHVGGSASNVKMNNGGVLKVGGSLSNSNALNNVQITVGGAVSNTPIRNGSTLTLAPVGAPTLSIPDAAEIRNLMTATSNELAAMASTGTGMPRMAGSRAVFEGTGAVTVFNVSASSFSSWNGIQFVLDPDESLIINVDVGAGENQPTLMANLEEMHGDFSDAANIIWNFNNATSVKLYRKLLGVVLAPSATVEQLGGSHEGTIVASMIRMPDGEVHNWGYDGYLPPPPPTIPVPAALPLMLAGLGGLGLLRLRRRS